MNNLHVSVASISSIVQNLSGGQQQAVAIGKTVYLNPKLIIMDEPTANIAVKEKNAVLDLMIKLKDRGISVIFITHTLQEIFDVTDRVVVLNRGIKVGDERIENITLEEVIKLIVGSEIVANSEN